MVTFAPAMKILFTPNWTVHHLDADDDLIQPPDKQVVGQGYWFFKYFPKGYQVDIIDRGRKSWFRDLEKKIKFYIKQPIRAFKCRNDYDIVVSHGAQSGLVYELLCSFVKNKPPHLMFDIGGLNGARINHYETPLIRFALRKCPYILVHTSRQVDFYREHYPELAEKVRFIPYGVDCKYFVPQPSVERTRTILTFGKAKRDNVTLCEAFARIADKRGYRLIVVGEPELSKRYDYLDEIIFRSVIPLPELMQLMAESDFIVIPLPEFLYSYGQMSFLQSMAMGKAAIITRTTSSRDYIEKAPGVIGVEPYDIDGMKHALEEMMDMTDAQRDAIGMANRSYATSRYDEREMSKAICDYINEIVNG